MMLQKNQYHWIVLGALVLFLVIYLISRPKNAEIKDTSEQKATEASTTTVQTSSPTAKPTTPTQPPIIRKPSIPTGQTASEAYLQALNTYQKSGYYIQFVPCQATPGSMILKKGSKVMLDNRDTKAHIIGIRSVRYNIGAFNFAIATLDSVGTNYVTCDGGGSAQITVVP